MWPASLAGRMHATEGSQARSLLRAARVNVPRSAAFAQYVERADDPCDEDATPEHAESAANDPTERLRTNARAVGSDQVARARRGSIRTRLPAHFRRPIGRVSRGPVPRTARG